MIGFYRALLRLYPAGFRAEYQEELCAVFGERMAGQAGPLRRLKLGLGAVADVVPNAAAAQWDVFRQDLRYSIRALRRTPGFALTAVLLVALGVGANTAAFSLADFVFLRPLPYRAADQLVKLWQGTPGFGRVELSPANYRDWKARARSVESMGAYTDREMNLVGTAEPRRLETSAMTPEVIQMLGVGAAAGRVFSGADSTNERVVVLSHALWRTQFGGDQGILNAVVRLNGEPFSVIGVMPPTFHFPSREVEAWTPLFFAEDDFEDRTDTYLEVIARLRNGATVKEAQAELTAISVQLEQEYPKENKDTRALALGLRDELSSRARLLVFALCGGALCILLLACANLASLFLARALHRARELAVRAALGAGRERLVRQLATESLGLAALGGLLGVAVALAGVPLLARLVPATLPTAAEPTVDFRVLIAAALLVGVTSLAFGVGPAVGARRISSFDALREGARTGGARTQRIRSSLVVLEVAASVVLLISSGLLLRAVLRIQSTEPGFRPEGVLTLRTALPATKYGVTARRDRFYRQVLEEVRALPGVQGAAYATGLPMTMRGGIWGIAMPGEEVAVTTAANSASLRFVTPQLFRTLGMPLRDGRDVADSDTRDAPWVAVVSESFVKRYWPGERAVGRRFNVASAERTIVGVVGDVRVRGLEQPSEPQVYLPAGQVADSALISYPPKDLVVRSGTDPALLLPAIRRIVRSADPEQPISEVRTMSEIVDDETVSRVTQLRVLGALCAIALLIAGVGIHGLLTFTVAQRSQEIGIRRALGEQAGSVVRRVLREGFVLALAGVLVGVWLAYLSAKAMGALLAGIRPDDPATIASAAALCLATAAIGCLRPAIRAAQVDPMTALRRE